MQIYFFIIVFLSELCAQLSSISRSLHTISQHPRGFFAAGEGQVADQDQQDPTLFFELPKVDINNTPSRQH